MVLEESEVMVVLGCYVRKCEVGEGAENQNGKMELLGLDFGRTIENGGGDQWGEVMRSRG